jgi:hypothetical protein
LSLENIMKRTILTALALVALTACSQNQFPTTATNELNGPEAKKESPSPPPSPWNVSTSTNEVTRETTVVATTGSGDKTIVVRQVGKKLECYLKTGQFLETVENMNTNRSVVKYRFDDGPIVSQGWSLSSDNTALFYVGDPTPFLNKMRKAKRIAIQYEPADIIPQTVSFDVTQFPVVISDILAVRTSQAADASVREKKMCAAWQAEYDAGIQDANAANAVLDKLDSHHCADKL